MSTLTTLMQISSEDLFPTPVDFTVSNDNTVAGNYSGFNTYNIGATPTQLNITTFTATGTNALYSYFAIGTASATGVFIGYENQNPFLALSPGDFAFFPLGQGTGATAMSDITAYSFGGSTSVPLTYFFGEKN